MRTVGYGRGVPGYRVGRRGVFGTQSCAIELELNPGNADVVGSGGRDRSCARDIGAAGWGRDRNGRGSRMCIVLDDVKCGGSGLVSVGISSNRRERMRTVGYGLPTRRSSDLRRGVFGTQSCAIELELDTGDTDVVGSGGRDRSCARDIGAAGWGRDRNGRGSRICIVHGDGYSAGSGSVPGGIASNRRERMRTVGHGRAVPVPYTTLFRSFGTQSCAIELELDTGDTDVVGSGGRDRSCARNIGAAGWGRDRNGRGSRICIV